MSQTKFIVICIVFKNIYIYPVYTVHIYSTYTERKETRELHFWFGQDKEYHGK